MLINQVEVITFPKIFFQKIIPYIQFYLFAHVNLNLTNLFFLPFLKMNVKKIEQRKPALSRDELRPELDFLCVHDIICALILFIWGAVLFLYILCYLLAYSLPLMCVQCNLFALNPIYVG